MNPTVRVDDTTLGAEAPVQIELRFLVHRSAAETFDLVTTRLPEWFGAIHEVRWDHSRSRQGPGEVGACSERVCTFSSEVPLTDHLGTFEVEPHELGAVVTWRQRFRARWFVPTALLRRQMRETMMRPAVESLFARFGGGWVDP